MTVLVNIGRRVPYNKIRYIAQEELVDVVGGPMTLDDLARELATTMQIHHPEYMVILIEKDYKRKKYHTTMYVDKEDFGKKD